MFRIDIILENRTLLILLSLDELVTSHRKNVDFHLSAKQIAEAANIAVPGCI